MNPIEQLKAEKNKYISIEDVLLFICKKYECSIEIAAEFLLKNMPESEGSYGEPCNPFFFGKLIGVSVFQFEERSPNLKEMLEDIISNKHYAYKKDINILNNDNFDDVPF